MNDNEMGNVRRVPNRMQLHELKRNLSHCH